MTIISDVEAAVTGQWWKLAIKLLPYGIICALAIALAVTRGTLHDVRLNDKIAAANTAKELAMKDAVNAHSKETAAENYAQRLQNINPVVVHDTNTIHEFSQTSAGQLPCLDADRVRDIKATESQLFPSETGNSQVRSNGTP